MWIQLVLGAWCAALAGWLGWRCIRSTVRSPSWWTLYVVGVVGVTCAVAVNVDGPELLPVIWLTAAGLVLAGVDVLLLRLPNVLVYPTVAFVAVWLVTAALILSQPGIALRVLLAAAAAGLAYLVLHLVSPQGLGMGDVKFAPAIAMVMGWYSWGWAAVAALGAFILAAAWGLALIVLGRASRELPFGPFMVAGAAITPVVADPLVMAW